MERYSFNRNYKQHMEDILATVRENPRISKKKLIAIAIGAALFITAFSAFLEYAFWESGNIQDVAEQMRELQ